MTASTFSTMVEFHRFRRDHRYVAARLSAHLDGELDERADWLVREHLAACRECRRELSQLVRTVRAIRRLDVNERRDPFVEGLIACVGAANELARRRDSLC